MYLKYLAFLILTFTSLNGYADLSIDYDKYWAQTLVGADIVRDEMREIATKRTVNFSIFDENFNTGTLNQINEKTLSHVPKENYVELDSHGNNVAYLITGSESLVSGTDQAQLSHFSVIYSYDKEAQKIIDTQTRIELANVSHDLRPVYWSYDDVSEEIQTLLNTKINFICSSGNYYPSPADEQKTGPCLQVGSLNQHGFVSSFSMEGKAVDILAPSDMSLASFDGTAERIFGGTSGSAPQVLAALVNLYAVFPEGAIDKAKAEQLLKVTSIPVPQTIKTEVNGAGVLNSYKLFRIGLKLRATSLKDSAIKAAITELSDEADALLKSDSISNENRIVNLRKAFLLGKIETQKKAALKISHLLTENSQDFARNFYNSFSRDFKLTEVEVQNIPIADSFAHTRFWIDTQKPSNQTIKDKFNTLNVNSKFAVLAEFSQFQSEQSFLESLATSSEKNSAYGGMTLGEWSEYLVQKFYSDK